MRRDRVFCHVIACQLSFVEASELTAFDATFRDIRTTNNIFSVDFRQRQNARDGAPVGGRFHAQGSAVHPASERRQIAHLEATDAPRLARLQELQHELLTRRAARRTRRGLLLPVPHSHVHLLESREGLGECYFSFDP